MHTVLISLPPSPSLRLVLRDDEIVHARPALDFECLWCGGVWYGVVGCGGVGCDVMMW